MISEQRRLLDMIREQRELADELQFGVGVKRGVKPKGGKYWKDYPVSVRSPCEHMYLLLLLKEGRTAASKNINKERVDQTTVFNRDEQRKLADNLNSKW